MRHPALLLLALLLLALPVGACQFLGAAEDGTDTARYAYVGRDTDGAVVHRGELFLHFEPVRDDPSVTHRIEGTWRIEGIPTYDLDRTLVGALQADGVAWIALHQHIADAGYSLRGTFEGGRRRVLAGTWHVMTIAGGYPGGSFEAQR